MIDSLLVANRGEIARRIIRTAKRLGIRTIAVYSEADADLPFVLEADEAVLIGPANPAQSYRNAEAILAAAKSTGAEAIHPGYGFLSENADFARAVEAAGLIWVGPSPDAITAMGDKINARNLMAAAGVPVAPGTADPAATVEAAVAEAAAASATRSWSRPRPVVAAWAWRRPSDEAALRAEYEKVQRLRRADVRRRRGADRALLPAGAPHRGADPRSGRRPRGGARRARVLGAAPQPEGGRGDAVARRRRGSAGPAAAPPRSGPARRSATATPAPSSACSTRPPATSSSWR